jgi:hypothetical protein
MSPVNVLATLILNSLSIAAAMAAATVVVAPLVAALIVLFRRVKEEWRLASQQRRLTAKVSLVEVMAMSIPVAFAIGLLAIALSL